MLAKVIIENGVKKIQALTADTGTGAPVGSYLYLEKKSNPQGYLYCDGSTFDETAYPALYQYLGTNVLPDWREFSAVGAEQNTTNVYDAQTNPNGVIHDHDVFAQGEAKDDQLQQHRHYAEQMPVTGGSAVNVAFSGTSQNLTLGNVTNSYRNGTVTRGKSRAVFIYIKATSGLTENQQENVLNTINENNSYSTEEHPTGKKWIDGKPIYRKVLPNITFSTNVTKKVDVGANIDKGWIDLSKTVFHSTWFPSTRQLFSNSGMTDIFVNDNNSGAESNVVMFTTPFNDGSGFGGTTYIDIVVEYTKTTD